MNTTRFFLAGRSAILLSAILLSACSSAESPPKPTVDDEDLERKIQTILNDSKIPVVSVTCPPGQEARKGESFECSAEDADGRPVKMSVKQKDDRGTLFVQTTTIYAPLVEQALEAGNAADADCPDNVPLNDGDGEIECTAVVRGKRIPLFVTVNAGVITSIIEGTGPGDPPDPACADLWSGGADPSCDECAARNCCDELRACTSGTPCAEYSLCANSCSGGDAGCLETSCGHLAEGKAAAEAVLECMTACPSSC
jgi:hypothetical protein